MTWVHDQIYAGGGEYIPLNWDEFSEQTGITSVLHFRPEGPADFIGPAPLAFEWMPIEDEDQADITQRLFAARFVRSQVESGRRVLLHSSLGRHRVRWAFVAYEIYSGRSWRAALRIAAEKPWLGPYKTDENRWREFARWIDRPIEIAGELQGVKRSGRCS
jgi:hypothetical protein